jgi:hypothetical protein
VTSPLFDSRICAQPINAVGTAAAPTVGAQNGGQLGDWRARLMVAMINNRSPFRVEGGH